MRKIHYILFLFLFLTIPLLFAEEKKSDIQLIKNPYNITSLRLKEIYTKLPMAHPSYFIQTINVNNVSQDILSFSDLFFNQEKALNSISEYSKKYFIEKLQQESLPQENFILREKMIQEGTSPTMKHYQHWNVMPNYLEITFERAQVQPSYYGEQVIDVPLSVLAPTANKNIFPGVFQLQPGDLLFQNLACGALCEGINGTTYGYNHTEVSHVGMVVSVDSREIMVVEAVSAGVQLTTLSDFLLRSVDGSGHPRVMVGRVDSDIKFLIPDAINIAMKKVGAPYNPTFSPRGHGFYCSQLISQSFMQANSGKIVFPLSPMNFKLEGSSQFSPAWVDYFSSLKHDIPQGELGNNPGMLSRDKHVHIVYFYGKL